MKKEIITEKRYSFELGGIRLKTGSVHKDLLTNVCLKNKKGKGVQLSFSKQDIKNLSSLFNELVSELEKEEKKEEINPDTSPCSSCQNTSTDPFRINCVSCDETFSKYKGEEKEIKEPKQETIEDKPEPIPKVCRTCKHDHVPIPDKCSRCNHSYNKWEPKE